MTSQLLDKPASRPVAQLVGPIAADLAAVERILADNLRSDRPHLARLLGHLGNYRGKRLRPILLLLTAQACGRVTPAHHVLAAVVEMIHTATLVHDDVLDAADLRRHAPTCNSRWGNQRSILLGDYLFSHAFFLVNTLGDPAACEAIARSTNRVCAGELHQISERGNLQLSEAEYLDIVDAKTAELTACACRLGARYAGRPAAEVDDLAEYGRLLGIAFQIADDLLDLVGKEETAGKSLGTDLDQQKLTLPLIHFLDEAPADRAERVRQILADSTCQRRAALAPFLLENGALHYARQRAEEFAAQARERLACLPASPCKELLENLTIQVVRRES